MVTKMFGVELFRGVIIDVDENEKECEVLYRIIYEDEDEEDLSTKDCMDVIKL